MNTARSGTRYRLVAAVVLAGLGTVVLWAVGMLLGPAFGGPWLLGYPTPVWMLGFCAAGALVTGFLAAEPDRLRFVANLSPATGIVFGTFAALSVGHALEQVLVERTSLDFQPAGLFIYATVVTSWWLVPAVAAVLTALNRLLARRSLPVAP